jgi:hypothetical protein
MLKFFRSPRGGSSFVLAAVFAGGLALAQTPVVEKPKLGHSHFGSAYDEGPRQKPWKMEGIGHAHMPITSSVPQVQEWFDQGITLLQTEARK